MLALSDSLSVCRVLACDLIIIFGMQKLFEEEELRGVDVCGGDIGGSGHHGNEFRTVNRREGKGRVGADRLTSRKGYI